VQKSVIAEVAGGYAPNFTASDLVRSMTNSDTNAAV
jgi:hypothetical protein